MLLHALLVPDALPLEHFLVEESLDADAPGLGAEMPAERIGAGKSSTTAPAPATLELAFANKLLLARVEPFVALAIVLSGKSLSTYRTNKRTLICMSA